MVEPVVVRVSEDEQGPQRIKLTSLRSALSLIVRLLWRRVAKRKVSFEVLEVRERSVRIKVLSDPMPKDPYVFAGEGDIFSLTLQVQLVPDITFEDPND